MAKLENTSSISYFRSGSNRPADIRGLNAVGSAIGVAVRELSENALLELEAVDVELFVDSGAFGEVQFDAAAGGLVVVRPMTDADWRRIFAVYRRLGAAHGSRLSVVAPDRVGDQDETLVRLERYRAEILELAELGVRVLVAIQKGRLSQAAFDAEVTRVLGWDGYVRAMPCKKAATTPAEIAEFAAAVRPRAIHLLGMGPRNRKFAGAVASILEAAPFCRVTVDSNWISANVGRGGSRPRLLTRCRDIAAQLIASGRSSIASVQELGIVLALGPDRYRDAAAARLAA